MTHARPPIGAPRESQPGSQFPRACAAQMETSRALQPPSEMWGAQAGIAQANAALQFGCLAAPCQQPMSTQKAEVAQGWTALQGAQLFQPFGGSLQQWQEAPVATPQFQGEPWQQWNQDWQQTQLAATPQVQMCTSDQATEHTAAPEACLGNNTQLLQQADQMWETSQPPSEVWPQVPAMRVRGWDAVQQDIGVWGAVQPESGAVWDTVHPSQPSEAWETGQGMQAEAWPVLPDTEGAAWQDPLSAERAEVQGGLVQPEAWTAQQDFQNSVWDADQLTTEGRDDTVLQGPEEELWETVEETNNEESWAEGEAWLGGDAWQHREDHPMRRPPPPPPAKARPDNRVAGTQFGELDEARDADAPPPKARPCPIGARISGESWTGTDPTGVSAESPFPKGSDRAKQWIGRKGAKGVFSRFEPVPKRTVSAPLAKHHAIPPLRGSAARAVTAIAREPELRKPKPKPPSHPPPLSLAQRMGPRPPSGPPPLAEASDSSDDAWGEWKAPESSKPPEPSKPPENADSDDDDDWGDWKVPKQEPQRQEASGLGPIMPLKTSHAKDDAGDMQDDPAESNSDDDWGDWKPSVVAKAPGVKKVSDARILPLAVRPQTEDHDKPESKGNDAPEKKFGELWEEPRAKVGLKLVGEISRNKWTYPLRDESRRSFVGYLQSPMPQEECQQFFDIISQGTEWKTPMGRMGPMPRRTSWMVKSGCSCRYCYGNFEVEPQVFPPWMLRIMAKTMARVGLPLMKDWPNSCNLNLYTDGAMSVGWHSDDESLFQGKFEDALIISLSLGVKRKFELRTNWPEEKDIRVRRMALGNGDIMTMEGMTQKHYQHRVPKEDNIHGPRINLTWRWVKKHTPQCPAST